MSEWTKAVEMADALRDEYLNRTTRGKEVFATLGVLPFILDDGSLGVHFMHLSESFSTDTTLLSICRENLERSCGDRDPVDQHYHCNDQESIKSLKQWRETLATALAYMDENMPIEEPERQQYPDLASIRFRTQEFRDQVYDWLTSLGADASKIGDTDLMLAKLPSK